MPAAQFLACLHVTGVISPDVPEVGTAGDNPRFLSVSTRLYRSDYSYQHSITVLREVAL